jgi:predicted nucleotidyltransferase
VKRARAVELAESVLTLLHEQQDEPPLSVVTELHVFGSFARGAPEVGDLDLNVEVDAPSPRWAALVESLPLMVFPEDLITRELRQRRRSIQVLTRRKDDPSFDMTLLWRRGDDLHTALARLHAIKEDPDAGRAPRDHMLPEFEGLDSRINQARRQLIREAVEAGALAIERFDLADRQPLSDLARRHLARRWKLSSPLYRAGAAVLAHLEDEGVDVGEVHLHGQDLLYRADTAYYAGFGLKYLRALPRWIAKYGCTQHLEVVHPTKTGLLTCLRLSTLRPDYFDREMQVRWQDWA